MRSPFPALVTRIVPVIAIVVAHALPARAAWPPDGLFVNPLTSTFSVASDGAGGVFVMWPQSFFGTLQRVSADGDLLLGAAGQNVPSLNKIAACVADGEGGVFVSGILAASHIVVRRFGPLGQELWSQTVVGTGTTKADLRMNSDGMGGVLIAWSEDRGLPVPEDARNLYVQRIDANGNPLWTSNGVRVRYTYMITLGDNPVGTNVAVHGVYPLGDGGAWVQSSGQVSPSADFDPTNVDHVSAAGGGISGVLSASEIVTTISDGALGMYSAKLPYTGPGYVKLHRSAPGAGNTWDVTLSAQSNQLLLPVHLAAVSDGVLVTWSQGYDIYAQKVSLTGTPLWTANGVPVCTVVGSQLEPVITTDHDGGAHVFWSDGRYGQKDIHWQHLDANGAPTMLEGGEVFATRVNTDDTRPTLYADPAGPGILAWNGGDGTYAKRFEEAPVAVAISRFTATARDGRVVLEAEMQSTLDIHGVHIYRATETGSLQLLHSAGAPGSGRFSYEDTRVLPGTRYRYQLVVSDNDGEFSSPIAELTTPALATELKQNHPNPFNPETTIAFSLETAARTTVHIYAVDGRHVRTLLDENRGVGFHRVTWNGTDDAGTPVSSGIYLYTLSADKYSATRKMLLLK